MSALPRIAPREQASVSQFRKMLYADLREILAIERRAYDFCWTETIFRDCIRADYHCRVLEVPHSFIQAYGVMSTAANEAHIFNVCVRPELQRRGLARRMLDHLLERAHTVQTQTVFLEVRASNAAALRLYQSAGFCEIGVRHGYYPAAKDREDAIVMAREL
ncbi:MAG: ribosomal protein S18-alanine N-acetyltransferase [Candidatus Competibacteraceae bacterium]|nr:ribosomal protein S18-alanine N-acetyltransferase [Candidatus Competibacteraceae bacterium]MCP5127212.1 ribosomal protein S18-alanine N-acetyltransferase [Gammaproteobacteria bacterium]HRX71074.1 ribosomal protein S18-alanine N-acetyltransferase [Candidatus Competibacteraceae bacterium]